MKRRRNADDKDPMNRNAKIPGRCDPVGMVYRTRLEMYGENNYYV